MPLKLYRRKGSDIWHYRGTVGPPESRRRLRGSCRTTIKADAERLIAEKDAREWKRGFDGPAAVLTFAQAALLYRAAGKQTRFLGKIEDFWRDTPVKGITGGAIRQSGISLYPTASGATRNRQVIVPTVAIINHAAEAELCQRIKVKRFPVEKKEKEPAQWEWVEAFMSVSSPHLGALACFMYLTGARISEALSLTWNEVDLTGMRSALIRQTKIGAERRARLPSILIAALANMPGPKIGRVFGLKAEPLGAWNNAIKRAGIKQLSFHACRHGFATGLLDRGVNPKTVAERGGWKSVQHVFETYAHDVASEDVTDLLVDTNRAQAPRKSLKVIGE